MSRRSFFLSLVHANRALHVHKIAEIAHSDTAILSLQGDTDSLLALIGTSIKENYWDPSALLSLGFKHELDDAEDQLSAQGHMLFLSTDRTQDLNDLKAAVPSSMFAELFCKDYFYAHLLGAMAEEVNLGAFDKGFEQMMDSDNVFHHLFKTLYVSDGSVHNMRTLCGSKTKASSLILLGNTNKRVVVAANHRIVDTFTTIPTPTSGPARYATIDESAFAAAAYNERRIYGLHVVQIANLIDGSMNPLEWRDTRINDGNVVELAIVDGAPGKLLLTLAGSEHRYVPVDVRFTQGVLQLNLDLKNATPAVANLDQPPIVRINANGTQGRGYIAHIDPSGKTIVRYNTIEAAALEHPAFARTISSVTNEDWGIQVDV